MGGILARRWCSVENLNIYSHYILMVDVVDLLCYEFTVSCPTFALCLYLIQCLHYSFGVISAWCILHLWHHYRLCSLQ